MKMFSFSSDGTNRVINSPLLEPCGHPLSPEQRKLFSNLMKSEEKNKKELAVYLLYQPQMLLQLIFDS